MRRRTLLGEGSFDPEFCEKRCPICTRARQGNRVARFFQAIEMFVTFGGCPWGRARQKKYGVPPNESVPLVHLDLGNRSKPG